MDTMQAIDYWITVSINAARLEAEADRLNIGEAEADAIGQLARRGKDNVRTLARHLAADLPGGVREVMTVALVNHAHPENVKAWDERIPSGVHAMLTEGRLGGHLADDYALHS